MKGVVLSFPKRGRRTKSVNRSGVLNSFARHAGLMAFVMFFTVGVVFGAISSSYADNALMDDMDFLFMTNLDACLTQSPLSAFAAHFASDFLFFAAALCCGLSLWGIGVLPFVIVYKGFGTGLSAAYLISSFGVKGLGFYLVVVLPGTFIFLLCLLFMAVECSKMSRRLLVFIFSDKENTADIGGYIKKFMIKCTYYLFVSLVGALVDMLLWSFVSKAFF